MKQNYRHVVVGAGVVGLSIARSLGRHGSDVLLMDRSDYGTAASGTNLGQLSVTDREPGLEIELVRETFEMYRAAQERRPLEYERNGGLCTLETAEDLAIARRIVPDKIERGYRLELLEGDAVRRVEPHIRGLAGGVFSPDEGRVNPFRVNDWLWHEARAAGVDWQSHTTLRSVEPRGDKTALVRTDRGDVTAETVILATGSWSRELLLALGVDLPVDYLRGTAMVTQPFPPVMNGPVEDGAFFTGKVPDGDTIYFGGVQEENGSIVIAQANRPGRGYNTDIEHADLCKMAGLFLKHYPSLKEIQIVRAWSGNTTTTADDLPYWGFCRDVPNLFLAVAFKGAFSLAPAVGEHTARWLVEGRYDPRYEAWSPARSGQ